MSQNEMFRLLMSLLVGGLFSWVIYSSAYNQEPADSSIRRTRFDPFIDPMHLTDVLAGVIGLWLILGWADGRLILSVCLGIAIETCVYYGVLLPLLPLLRKVFRPSTVAALWLLPNVLYFTLYSYMRPSEPKSVLSVPIGAPIWLLAVWGAGSLFVLGRAIARHLAYRHELLRDAISVTDSEILEIWDREKANIGWNKVEMTPLYSPAAVTPLSIGVWRKTTRILLPRQEYTPEELRLIFRHELIHTCHRDGSTKLFLTLCQAVFWFNPLMWIAMRKCADDLELSCDELALADADANTRETYARLILRTAGDERGFTSCLSVRAKALRYRLQGIVAPRARLVGGLLAGLLIAALLLTNGMVAVAYAPATGEDVIFSDQSADYTPTSIALRNKGAFVFSPLTCTDSPAFHRYLADLTLCHITGIYDPRGDYLIVTMNGESLSVSLYEHLVVVEDWDGHQLQKSRLYYSPEPLDLDYLMTLMEEKT
ncbi:MAG: M56 family metallopeptidase [Oscillospiraceae bacterium]|nr:M56 family metallopeptidase [Oscillospiraceae bacterium]